MHRAGCFHHVNYHDLGKIPNKTLVVKMSHYYDYFYCTLFSYVNAQLTTDNSLNVVIRSMPLYFQIWCISASHSSVVRESDARRRGARDGQTGLAESSMRL